MSVNKRYNTYQAVNALLSSLIHYDPQLIS